MKKPPAKNYLYPWGCSERNERHAGRICVSVSLLLPLGYSLLCSGLFAYSVFILSPQLSKTGLISSVSEPLGGIFSLFYRFCSLLTGDAIEVGKIFLQSLRECVDSALGKASGRTQLKNARVLGSNTCYNETLSAGFEVSQFFIQQK